MTTFGVTNSGFVAKATQDVLSDIEADELTTIDAALDVSAEQPLGQINGIYADKLAAIWELLAVAYNGMNRDSAEGPQLDNINGLTGTKRLPAKPSRTKQTCVFSQVGVYPTGGLVANVTGQPSVQFANIYDITVQLAGVYQAIQNTVVLATNPTLPITVPNVDFVCTVNGPTVVNAGTLNVISTPVTGWTSTTNPLDAVVGTNIETDTDYRLRGEQEISAIGSGNPDALRADVLNVSGVIECSVIENTSSYSFAGVPGHSFETIVWDGIIPQASNTDIAQAIWNDKPTGIASSGFLQAFATDSHGVLQPIKFSRAVQHPLYMTIVVTMLPGFTMTTQLAAALKTAIVNATQSKFFDSGVGARSLNPAYLGLGNSIGAQALRATVLDAGMNVFDVTTFQFDLVPSPTNTANIFLGARDIAIADTSRITINGI